MTSPGTNHPRLLWNASPSVPVGLYWVTPTTPARNELAAIALPEPLRTLIAARGYLAKTALLIKPVAAAMGDLVCRRNATVTINGQPVAHARTTDALGRPLPGWTGCMHLAAGQILVLSTAPESFDSRYFGPIDRSHVVGAAHPLWVSQPHWSPQDRRGSVVHRETFPPL